MRASSSFLAICSSVSGLRRILFFDHFFDERLSVRSDMPPPPARCRFAEKERSSSTPAGCAHTSGHGTAYRRGVHADFLGHFLTSWAERILAVIEIRPGRAMMDWQTRRMVCLRCSMFFITGRRR